MWASEELGTKRDGKSRLVWPSWCHREVMRSAWCVVVALLGSALVAETVKLAKLDFK